MELVELTLYENSCFCVMFLMHHFIWKWDGISYMKIVMDFVEGLGWKIKYLPI